MNNSWEYQNAFTAIQEQVDKGNLSPQLGKALVNTLNEEARKYKVPVKFNPDDLDITPLKYRDDVGDERDDKDYYEEELSSEEFYPEESSEY